MIALSFLCVLRKGLAKRADCMRSLCVLFIRRLALPQTSFIPSLLVFDVLCLAAVRALRGY